MDSLRQRILIVVGTATFFLLTLCANEWIFSHSEFVRGVNWVYLPAGMRLLCTLLFGEMGALGILCASWISCFFYYFPNDPVRSFFGGIISALAPYLVYLFAKRALGLRTSLSNLTAKRLLLLIVLYSFASPALHQAWLALHGDTADLARRFFVMFVGDLSGSLILIYTLKLGLWCVLAVAPLPRAPRR
jgi:hypothetical protein